MKVSVCMIVRNEEQILAQAIASTRGLADEIVVLDTGSTDETVALAESLDCVTITGGDRMHKAQSRNHAIGAATGDWVVILDADETIADPVGLRAFLVDTDAQAVFIKLAYMNEANEQTLTYQQMRCWRRDTYRYKYRAHELPIPVNGWGKLEHTTFVWEHRPPAGRDWKSDYTRDRLLLDIAENPDDARPAYYMGRQYMYRGEWEPAIEQLERYLALGGKHDKADAHHCLSKCHAGLGQKKEQIEALHMACAAQPMRRDWWCSLASIYHQEGNDAIALGLLRCAEEIPLPQRSYATHYWHGAHFYDLTARCLWKLRRYHEGREYALRAVELAPGDKRIGRNLLWFDERLGDMDAFYQLYGHGIHSGCGRHRAIADLVKGPCVLDVGCGTGDLLLLLQEVHPDWELAGTDISQVALDMARDRGVIANLFETDTVPVPIGEKYDTIVMAQVLEHVDDAAEMIEAARVALSVGGKLIVSVPNGGAIPSPHHAREYTAESLTKLLEPIGQPELLQWSGQDSRLLAQVTKVTKQWA